MANVDSDMESEFDIYNEVRDRADKEEIYLEEEVADDLLDESTTGVLRTLGGGFDDSELLRSDLHQAIDTSLAKFGDLRFTGYLPTC